MHVSYELAQQIVDKAVEKSKQIGVKMCIAILDSGGNLKSFTRMDDAWVGSIDIAIKKAKTAWTLGKCALGNDCAYCNADHRRTRRFLISLSR